MRYHEARVRRSVCQSWEASGLRGYGFGVAGDALPNAVLINDEKWFEVKMVHVGVFFVARV